MTTKPSIRLSPTQVAIALADLIPFILYCAVLPRLVNWGPLVGSRQDEWYNLVRSLRILFDSGNIAYYIHPSFYYELLATILRAHGLYLQITGSIPNFEHYIEFLVHDDVPTLNVARSLSVAAACVAVLLVSLTARRHLFPGAGALAGLFLISTLTLADVAGSVRVDALFVSLLAASLLAILEHNSDPTRFKAILAAVLTGIAVSTNYPGVILIPLLGLSLYRTRAVSQADLSREIQRWSTAIFALVSTYAVLNLHQLFNAGDFWHWFSFQASTLVETHPHAREPQLFYYLRLLASQNVVAVASLFVGGAAVASKNVFARSWGILGIGVGSRHWLCSRPDP